MYGQGVYFASSSSKSARDIYTKGSNKLLLCKVLLGKSLTAQEAMNHLTPDSVRRMGYDSLYAPSGSAVRNDECVVYNPAQALPCYIIHYSLTSTTELPSLVPTMTGSFRKETLFPKRHYDDKDPKDVHFMVAESRFLRMLAAKGNLNYKITSIDLVTNPVLAEKFNKKRAELEARKVDHKPILSF